MVVVSFVEKRNGKPYWLCECDCGKEKIICEYNFTSGATQSCGCKKRNQITKMNKGNIKHGQRNTRLYKIWCGMKYRCYNPNSDEYGIYGGRGIVICDEWKEDFQSFYNWAISNGYKYDLTIDRIDVNGNYEPSNCRWVTMKTQENNKRNNRIIEYKNKKQTISQWADEIGIRKEIIYYRLNHGWSIEKTLTQPVKKHKKQRQIL